MMPFNNQFNPMQVTMGAGGKGPYMNTKPVKGTPKQPTIPGMNNGVIGAQAVRATGSGPYDSAYRQNLATYAGGQFQRPGGFLGINPTGPITGTPTVGGTAPVQGVPNSLLSMALGAQPQYQAPQPTPSQSTNANSIQPQNWQNWIQNLMGNQFGGMRMP